jgi:hypothetical protein
MGSDGNVLEDEFGIEDLENRAVINKPERSDLNDPNSMQNVTSAIPLR